MPSQETLEKITSTEAVDFLVAIDDAVLKDIIAGKYRDQYLIYNRKSTDDADNQQNSIKYQKAENMRMSLREKLRVAQVTLKGFCVDGIISEKHSAFKTNSTMQLSENGRVEFTIERPKFMRLAYFLKKGYFKGVIMLSKDRASRNDRDEMIIGELTDQGADFRFVNAKYDKSSAGELHKDIDAMVAKHHSRVTSEKVTYAFRNLREDGKRTHRAPVGYLNPGSMHEKPLDSVRAPIIRHMFELCAEGGWNLTALAKWANSEGLTMPPMRRRRTAEEIAAEEDDEDMVKIEKVCRPLDPGDVQRIIYNPYYEGKTHGNDGEWVQSTSHEPLVSKELAGKAQAALKGRRTSKHYSKKLALAYRDILHCNTCGRVYTPYEQKGKIYLGARCAKDCPNIRRNLPASALEGMVRDVLIRLAFTPGEATDLDSKTQTSINDIEDRRNKALEQGERRKKTIREELKYLHENRIPLLKAGVYTPESYVDEEKRLNTELAALQLEEQNIDASAHEVIVEILKLSELLKYAHLHYFYANPEEKERIMRTVFSELKLAGNTLEYIGKNGFKSLQHRFFAISDPTENRTPLSTLRRSRPNR